MPTWVIIAIAALWVGFPFGALAYGAWRIVKEGREERDVCQCDDYDCTRLARDE
jgi:hypothetical protein